jgi:hypothetical protein
MIVFRCWKCHRKFSKLDSKIGQTLVCNCGETIRIPKVSFGKSRIKTITDRVVEAVVCGGGGALLGFLLAIVILAKFRFFRWGPWELIPALTIGFGLIGFFLGERGIDWIGDRIREHERD